MFLLNADRAFIDDRKLMDYCLSESHPIGKHKAKVFKSALGFSVEHFPRLKEIILQAVLEKEANFTESNQYGELYVVDIEVENPPDKALVRTSWIVRFDEDFPRLTSCYVINK